MIYANDNASVLCISNGIFGIFAPKLEFVKCARLLYCNLNAIKESYFMQLELNNTVFHRLHRPSNKRKRAMIFGFSAIFRICSFPYGNIG
jgi:hypothetical protein